MTCLSAESLSELEFAHTLRERGTHGLWPCGGRLIRMEFRSLQVYQLEQVFDGSTASDLLWEGFAGDGADHVRFELCCTHWFDLAIFIELQATENRRRDWSLMSSQVFLLLCREAGWDAKELLNMVTWVRERLT